MLRNPAYAGAFVYGRTRSIGSSGGQAVMTRLPWDEWRIVVKDRYPALRADPGDAARQPRGVSPSRDTRHSPRRRRPAPGYRLVRRVRPQACCAVPERHPSTSTGRYACTTLQRTQGAAMCQRLPANPIDACVVDAFFEAVAPAELEAWERAQADRHQPAEALDRAETQQVERLRYQALLAER